MSNIPKLLSPRLIWSELLNILSFLSLNDMYCLGKCSNNGFILFLREKNIRLSLSSSSLLSIRRLLSQGLKQDKVVLVSYPRSGNSFLRLLLEDMTGIVTGSDSRTNRTLSASLLRCGFHGEGIVDPSVWIIKSHYPERMGYIKFASNRIVLLVRNPFDALESYFHMGLTNTHNKVLTDESLQRLSSIWEKYVVSEINTWISFHEWWLKNIDNVPIIIIRYEDLLLNQYNTMNNIMTFLNKGHCPQGYQRYNNHNNESLLSPNIGYQPKKGGIGKSFRMFTDKQVSIIEEKCCHLLKKFGYKIITNNNDNNTRKYCGIEVLQGVDNNNNDNKTVFSSSLLLQNNQIIINDNICIRNNDDLFGRKMTNLRKSMTDDDKEPFPVY